MDWTEIYARLRRDRGDHHAWDGLWRRVYNRAKRDLWEYGWAVVEDATEDTASAVVVGFAQARGAESFGGFVWGHYLNVRGRVLARHRVRTVFDQEAVARSTTQSLPDPYDRALLERCLAALDARQQRATELFYFHDLPHAELARELGVTEQNARQMLSRARAKLRECVQREWPHGRG